MSEAWLRLLSKSRQSKQGNMWEGKGVKEKEESVL